jgi:uncharacterized protein (TIGR02271 family)
MTHDTNVNQRNSDAGAAGKRADSGIEVVRSGERLLTGTETVATERVRVEKFVVTEERTFTVTVRREDVRLVREPLDGTEVAADRVDGVGNEELLLTLSEERVVVTKEVVPVERVRVWKEWITERQDIAETVRAERIAFTPPEA